MELPFDSLAMGDKEKGGIENDSWVLVYLNGGEIYRDTKSEREIVWEEEEVEELVVCFGQVEFHMPAKYSNGGIK